VVAVIDAALDPDPDKRPQDGVEMARLLRASVSPRTPQDAIWELLRVAYSSRTQPEGEDELACLPEEAAGAAAFGETDQVTMTVSEQTEQASTAFRPHGISTEVDPPQDWGATVPDDWTFRER